MDNAQETRSAGNRPEENETNFSSLFLAMTEGVAIHRMIYDKEGRPVDYTILNVNPAFEKTLGIPAEKARGSLGSKLYGSEHPPYLDIYDRVLKTREPYFFTTYFEPLDRYFEISIFIPGKDLFATVFLDVTGSKRAEAELRRIGTKYRRLYESMMDGFAYTDMDGHFRESNSCFREMLGYSEEELLNLSYKDITPHTWLAYEQRIIENQVIPYGYSEVFQKEYIKKDGTVFPVELRLSLIKDEKGKPEGVWAVTRDITERKRSEQEYEQMIDRFNLATHSANLGVWELDVRDNSLLWDDKMLELFDVPKEEFTENLEAWYKTLHPDDFIPARKILEEAIRGEREYDTEFRVVHRDGSVHLIKAFAQVVNDSGGIPVRMTGINFDITEQKRIQESLVISELFNRSLVESAPLGILFLDQHGQMAFVNPALQKIIDIPEGSPLKTIGTPFQEHPEIRTILQEEDIARIIQGKQVNALQFQYRTQAGKELELELHTAPLMSVKDEVHGIILMVVDITEQTAANQELRVSERKYRRLFDSMRDGFVMMNMEKQIIEVNSAYLEMTGYTQEELYSMKGIRNIVPERWYPIVDKILEQQLKVYGYTDVFELEYVRKNGTIFPLELRLFLIKNEQGGNEGIWGIVRDITERKKMEQELMQMNALLEVKVNEKTQELRERVSELERFNRATIDRELRMKELRTKIEELEKKLGNK
ncbi:MAG: PAS domain S-box protein [Bacteroidetes bacterium]|nr:PAS domain S-box protein [Bacteroidota bacterium]